MGPWIYILLLIVAAYLLVMAVLGIRDFIIWYREGREFANERKKAKELRQSRKSEKLQMPVLKERPADTSKPPDRPK